MFFHIKDKRTNVKWCKIESDIDVIKWSIKIGLARECGSYKIWDMGFIITAKDCIYLAESSGALKAAYFEEDEHPILSGEISIRFDQGVVEVDEISLLNSCHLKSKEIKIIIGRILGKYHILCSDINITEVNSNK